MAVYLLAKELLAFPDPSLAREDGLLAVGGEMISQDEYRQILAKGIVNTTGL